MRLNLLANAVAKAYKTYNAMLLKKTAEHDKDT